MLPLSPGPDGRWLRREATTGAARRPFFRPRLGAATLFEANGFADAVAEEVELGATHDAAPFDFDLIDAGAVERELPFDALAGDDPPDGEHFRRSRPAAGDGGSGEDLNPLFLAFQDLGLDIDRIADVELGDLRFDAGFFHQLHQLLTHCSIALSERE